MRIPTQSPKEQRCDQLREERWDPASTEHSGFVMAGGDGSHWRWDEKKKKSALGCKPTLPSPERVSAYFGILHNLYYNSQHIK